MRLRIPKETEHPPKHVCKEKVVGFAALRENCYLQNVSEKSEACQKDFKINKN